MRSFRPFALAAAAAAAVLVLPSLADGATTIGQSDFPPGQMIEFHVGPGVFAQITSAGPSYEVPAGGGVITSWSLVTGNRPSFTGPYTLELLRANPDNSYTVAARDPEHITTSADGSPVASTFSVRIPVSGGELLAVWDGAAGTQSEATLALQDTANMTDGAAEDTNQPTDPASGSSVSFGLVEFQARLLLSAVMEPDADHDGFGDETQDQCPSNASIQGPCPPVSPPVVKDTSPPLVSASIAKLLKLSRHGSISFVLTSSENATGTASATVALPKSARVARFKTTKLRLSAGKRTRVSLRLTRSALTTVRRALRHHRLKTKITVTLKDAAGNRTVKKRTVKLTR